MQSPITIHKLLSATSGDVASLITHARRLARYSHWLASILPPPLGQHCVVADIQGNKLIIGVDSAAWATKIRFLSIEIIEKITLKFKELKNVEQVLTTVLPPAPDLTTVTQPSAEKLHLSQQNAALIQSLAETVDDPQLKAALLRLASHRDVVKN